MRYEETEEYWHIGTSEGGLEDVEGSLKVRAIIVLYVKRLEEVRGGGDCLEEAAPREAEPPERAVASTHTTTTTPGKCRVGQRYLKAAVLVV